MNWPVLTASVTMQRIFCAMQTCITMRIILRSRTVSLPYITENMPLNVSKMPVRRIPRSVWSCSTLMISSSTMSFTVPRKEIIWSRSVHRQSFQRSARLTSHSVMVQMFLWYWHKGMIPPVQVHLLMRSSIISSVCGAKTIPCGTQALPVVYPLFHLFLQMRKHCSIMQNRRSIMVN